MRSLVSSRRGNVIVVVALLVPVLIGMVALAVDISWVAHAKSQLEVATDSCALATAHYIANQGVQQNTAGRTAVSGLASVFGQQFMHENPVAGMALNPESVHTGYAERLDNARLTGSFTPSSANYDAVRVVTTMSQEQELPSFFGVFYGRDAFHPTATSIAIMNTTGLAFLPYTIKKETWDQHLDPASERYQDNWTWDDVNGVPINGVADGVPEVVLFPNHDPNQGECNGTSGTLNIALDSQGTKAFAQQIVDGATLAELETEFGPFTLTPGTYGWDSADADNEPDYEFGYSSIDTERVIDGNAEIDANPGLSVGSKVRAALESRIGEIIGIFIHETCAGNGSNSSYTIPEIRFGRLMGFTLTTGKKGIFVQPSELPEPISMTGYIEVLGIGY